ncbi:hypothetical protein E2C01_039238 [Portunus trituberculatus]|uniref:Uncharacterized protein n=1 Tax=Portunus trituberculatus TaxID=210409 RepID=A0A5B7FJC1_PORTR|nr:hypothetical protein [Portunus trituberculatus]
MHTKRCSWPNHPCTLQGQEDRCTVETCGNKNSTLQLPLRENLRMLVGDQSPRSVRTYKYECLDCRVSDPARPWILANEPVVCGVF